MEVVNPIHMTTKEREDLLGLAYGVTDNDLRHLTLTQAASYIATMKKIEKLKKREAICKEIVGKLLE